MGVKELGYKDADWIQFILDIVHQEAWIMHKLAFGFHKMWNFLPPSNLTVSHKWLCFIVWFSRHVVVTGTNLPWLPFLIGVQKWLRKLITYDIICWNELKKKKWSCKIFRPLGFDYGTRTIRHSTITESTDSSVLHMMHNFEQFCLAVTRRRIFLPANWT